LARYVTQIGDQRNKYKILVDGYYGKRRIEEMAGHGIVFTLLIATLFPPYSSIQISHKLEADMWHLVVTVSCEGQPS
jgi:hypothetical protein